MHRKGTVAWIAFLFIVASVVAGAVSTNAVPGPPVRVAGALPPDLAGVWQGQWVDTVFTVTGPMEWTLDVNGSAVTLTGTNDLTEVSGLLGPAEPFELTGTIVGDSLGYTFMFSAGSALTTIGDGSIVGSGADNMTGSCDVGAPLNFGLCFYTATISSTTLAGTFEYPGGGAGTIQMTKNIAVEPETWAGVKGRYRSAE